jgi:AcrR family transcriptional regulator
MNVNSVRERRSQKRPTKKLPEKLRVRFRQETAQAVLEAAEEVFVEKGLHAASMGEIARRAGVAVGTLYNHFADREALLGHLLDMRCRELLQQLDHDLKELQHANFVGQLMAVVNNFFSMKEKHRALFVIVVQEEQAGRVLRSDDIKREVYRRIEKLVHRGVKEGYLRERDSELFPSLLMGMFRGIMMRPSYGAPETPLGECTGPLVDFFLHGARSR